MSVKFYLIYLKVLDKGRYISNISGFDWGMSELLGIILNHRLYEGTYL